MQLIKGTKGFIQHHFLRATKSGAGFSTVEMLVAVALFTMVVLMSIASMITMIDANQKARSVKVVVDNLHFVIEEIARDLRLGSKYYCASAPTSASMNATRDCPYNNNSGGGGDNLVAFRDRNSQALFYWYDASGNNNNGCIKKKAPGTLWTNYSDTGSGYTCITSSDVKINFVRFYVYNTAAPSSGNLAAQPFVIVAIKGTVGTKVSTQTSFSIMTSLSQRIPHDAE
ncbi:MAG: hypothetical protein A3C06_01585 [Candidatus Taylorbacteria bacterium RIFCSPHIGHO2_02_FULL_46_13]|uniref:Type II secretion system protein J n=1 Tax=Candidatus Taylorbacteria bacterium RIFCSPHIGHO2_02_FULL_46_13 TaxID=1802312 RepID=A0A1G2MRK4_9BACT|nr:MAG: hypothetical protein A3C06_01585 [Candidatus Taylorbacteria bacterium RIFCSPHIGHO2_02_FULL_46_13]